MYRIYLDWNVISNLKKSPNEHYAALATLIGTHRSRLWIPYSVAHLRDLGRGYEASNPEKVRYTYRDLGYLVHLTRGHCLETHYKQDKPRKGWRDPFEFFEELQESKEDDTATYEGFTSLLKSETTPEIAELGKTLTDLMDSLPMPYPEQASAMIDKMFPKWKELQTLSGIMQDMYSVLGRMQSDFTYSQELRAEIDAHMPVLNPKAVSSAKPADAFTHIDQLLSPLLGGKSFFKIIADSRVETNSSAKPKTESDRFFEAYYSLDMFGYKREKLSAKNHFPNILDDITHAYLAGHCDFFIAEDKTLRAKAAAVYAQEKVHTRICTVEEAVKELTERLSTSYNSDNLFRIFNDALEEAVQEDRLMPSMRSEEEVASYYYLGWLFLDRFNTVRVDRTGEFGPKIQFMEFKINYSDSILTEELTDLVSTLVNCLGVDKNGQALLQRSEWGGFAAGVWQGRRWDLGRISLLVRLDSDLGLVFEYMPTAPAVSNNVPPSNPANTSRIHRLRQWIKGFSYLKFRKQSLKQGH